MSDSVGVLVRLAIALRPTGYTGGSEKDVELVRDRVRELAEEEGWFRLHEAVLRLHQVNDAGMLNWEALKGVERWMIR